MKLRLIASMMIMLVLTIPFIMAASLDVQRFSGNDGTNNWVRSPDTLQVEVIAKMPGSPTPDVAKSLMRISVDEVETFFDVCQKTTGDDYACAYTTDDIIAEGADEYMLKLYTPDGNIKESQKQALNVDYTKPRITDFSITPQASKTGEVTLTYSAHDAASAGDTSTCSGLKRISFQIDGVEKGFDEGDLEQCTATGSYSYTHQTTAAVESVQLCAVAYDYLNQDSVPSCDTFRVDNNPPSVTGIELRDSQGFEISHVRTGQTFTADVFITINSEDDVDFSTVRADLSKLNPTIGERGPDENFGDLFIFRNVPVTSPGTCEVPVRAVSDELGNTGQATTLTCTLPVDDEGPAAIELNTIVLDEDGTPLLAAIGTLIAQISDAGSGMDKAQAFLDLRNIGLGQTVKADECTKLFGDNWECKWNVQIPQRIGSGDYDITLKGTTRDDLDNELQETLTQTIRVDKTPPSVTGPEIIASHPSGANFGPLAVGGSDLDFVFDVSDVEEATADMSALGGGDITGVCTDEECVFTTSALFSGPYLANLEFEFKDLAGNVKTILHDIFVFGLADDPATNYWTSQISCSPALVDRDTASLIPHTVYCQVALSSGNPDVEPAYTQIGDITDCDTGDAVGYVQDVYMMNNALGSRDPFWVIELAAKEMDINELTISCPLTISTRIDQQLAPNPETETISHTIQFYNLPAGVYADEYEDEIEDALDKALKDQDWIDTLVNVVNALRQICNIKNIVTTILGAIDAVLGFLGAFVQVLNILYKPAAEGVDNVRSSLCGQGKGPLEQLWSGTGDLQGVYNIIDEICNFVDCQMSASEQNNDLMRVASYGAGGGAYCGKLQDLFSLGLTESQQTEARQTDKDGGYEAIDVTKPQVNVKESLIWSSICFCIPGIIYNMNKLRQIECRKAVCLGKDVRDLGYPASYCADEYEYLWCTFVLGEIFKLFPILQLYDQFTNILKDFYSNPLSLVSATSSCLCGGCKELGIGIDYCDTSSPANGPLYTFCTISKLISRIGDVVAGVQALSQMDSDFWGTGNEWCEEADDLMD